MSFSRRESDRWDGNGYQMDSARQLYFGNMMAWFSGLVIGDINKMNHSNPQPAERTVFHGFTLRKLARETTVIYRAINIIRDLTTKHKNGGLETLRNQQETNKKPT